MDVEDQSLERRTKKVRKREFPNKKASNGVYSTLRIGSK